MRTVFIFALLAVASAAARAGDFQPFAGPAPIFVWINSNPWLMVIGSDTPQVVLYDTGQVIYTKMDKGAYAYHSCVLDATQLAEFKQKLAGIDRLKSLKPFYNLVEASDQPMTEFYIHVGASETVTEIYGLTDPESLAMARERLHPSGKTDRVPPQLIGLYDYVSAVDYPACDVWKPQYIEVMLSPFDNSKGPIVQWPSDWPVLSSDHAMRRHEDQYSIFLDGTKLADLQRLQAGLKDNGALVLGGRKWSMAYRPVVPSEPIWRKAFEQAEEQ